MMNDQIQPPTVVLVVVTILPEMLSVVGAKVVVRPVGEATITARIDPSAPVITLLTVPIETPLVLWTVRPVERPARLPLATLLRARTELELACAIPLGEACSRPWLPLARTLAFTVPLTALFAFARSIALAEAFSDPWLLMRAFIDPCPRPADTPP